MRISLLDQSLNVFKVRSFLFCVVLVAVVGLLTVIRHILILNILSQKVRSFLSIPIAISYSLGLSLQSIIIVYCQMKTASLDLLLKVFSQKVSSFQFYFSFPVAGVKNILSRIIRGFVFYSLPLAWVALVTEICHTKILNILSQTGRCFLYNSFPVAGVVMFEALFVNIQSNEKCLA